MHRSALSLALAGLLGGPLLAPTMAAASPHHDDDRYERYASPYRYGPIAVEREPYSSAPTPRRCNVGTVLGGAAIGGGLGTVLANNPRNRLWSLPIGAAVGGVLGGLISGC